MSPMVSALSEAGQRQVAYQMETIRKALDARPYATAVVQKVCMDAFEAVLSIAAPRLRELVEAKGSLREDGSLAFGTEGGDEDHTLVLETAPVGTGKAEAALKMMGRDEYGEPYALFKAAFLHEEGTGTWCAAHGETEGQSAILDALDGFRPHLPAWDGSLAAGPIGRLGAEAELLRADGGFPGPACREYLGAIRDAAVRGSMLAAARELPDLAGMHQAAGFRWGERYIAYDRTDKRGCRISAADATACFHENFALCDDHSSWVIGIQKAEDGSQRVAVWAFDRYRDDPVQAIASAASDGLSALGDPHVSVDMATGEVLVREGFYPGVLAHNVLHGLVREREVLGGLSTEGIRDDVELRSDFHSFTPLGDDEDEVGPPMP